MVLENRGAPADWPKPVFRLSFPDGRLFRQSLAPIPCSGLSTLPAILPAHLPALKESYFCRTISALLETRIFPRFCSFTACLDAIPPLLPSRSLALSLSRTLASPDPVCRSCLLLPLSLPHLALTYLVLDPSHFLPQTSSTGK